MPLGAQVWTLDGITFSPSPDARDHSGVQWILTQEKGFWGSPKTGATFSPRLQRHGAWRSPGWKIQRTISLVGRCYASDYAALRHAESRVLALLSDPTEPGSLTCYTEFGPLTCDVFLDDDIVCTALDVVSEPGFEFSVQIVAPDPRKYTPEWVAMSATLPMDSGDGLDFAHVIPPDTNQGLDFGNGTDTDGLTFGTSNSSGFMELSNVGTAPTYPVFTFHGPLTSPTLTTTDGAVMRYNDTIDDGEYVVIDTTAPSVMFNGVEERRQLLYPARFDGFQIPAAIVDTPGVLSLGLSHSGPATDTGYVDARYRSAWF